jgi:glycerol-3-phosphate O-acyltransferase
MVPPHIAARENMAFGPFGYIFRRAGAFFLRRSFDDDLYKEVFRSYVSYLVREGFPQEFFIEGGRSRTGRTLTPKLGMLSWNIDAFLDSGRRDLFLVPVAITYERLVEESAMISELAGQNKSAENLRGLFKARKILGRRWGSATIRFDEPISVAAAIGDTRERLVAEGSDDARRDFVAGLGNRIVERINACTDANATSVAAAVFLGAARQGLLRHELTARVQELVELLRVCGAELTPALEADLPDFGDSVAFLRRSDLIRSVEDERGEILYFEDAKRRALDIYRNSILHFLAPASFLARRLIAGATRDELREDLRFWAELFYHEFFNPADRVLGETFDGTLRHFERAGIAELDEGRYRAADKGRAALNTLVLQTQGLQEAYLAAFRAALAIREPTSVTTLENVAGEAFLRSELLGEIRSPEVASRATFANAFDALARRHILARHRDPDVRVPVYRPGENFDELVSLCARLAGALGDG